MEGFVKNTSEWSRIYFIAFYLITVVVVNVVIAFILDAILFQIQCKRKTDSKDGERAEHSQILISDLKTSKNEIATYEIALHKHEVNFCNANYLNTNWLLRKLKFKNANNDAENATLFHGYRTQGKRFAFNLKMFACDESEWIEHAESRENLAENSEYNSEIDLLNTLNKDYRSLSCVF